MATVTAPDGTRLAVTAVGAPGAPAVVVAHGAGSSARFVIDAFAAPLAAAGLGLTAYDLRGHGHSDPVRAPQRHRLADHVADLAAVADHAGARLVGGVSLGAHAAARLAATRPDAIEGLLLALPAWTGQATPGAGPHAAVAATVRARGVGALLAQAVADSPPWLAALLARDWMRHDPDSLAAALVALDGGDAPTLAELATIATPAAVVAWQEDPGHPFEVAAAWADALPAAVLAETSLSDVGRDPAALGRAVVAAYEAACSALA